MEKYKSIKVYWSNLIKEILWPYKLYYYLDSAWDGGTYMNACMHHFKTLSLWTTKNEMLQLHFVIDKNYLNGAIVCKKWKKYIFLYRNGHKKLKSSFNYISLKQTIFNV